MKKKLLTVALAAVMVVSSAITSLAATQVYFEDFEDGAVSIIKVLVKAGLSKSNGRRMNLVEYLENSQDIQTNKVRRKILEEGIKPHKCECCGLETWMNNPIPLELHHKDGNRHNNTLENYELLCPNCHTFTDSYRGKNSRKE